MSQLARTQQLLLDHLLSPKQQHDELSALIQPQGKVSIADRLKIYANAYRIRLKEVIETDHQQLCLYLGDELFDKMAEGYIQSHPSKFRSLRDFCDQLPNYLRQDTFFSQYPILADMAQFERLLLCAFDAADTQRADFSQLQALPAAQWPTCRLILHPSVQLFYSRTNAVACWQAIKQKQTPPDANNNPQCWLLWRGESRLTEFISLQTYQQTLLEQVIQGENFAGLCEAMLTYTQETSAPQQVLESIKAWFEMGIIWKIAVN